MPYTEMLVPDSFILLRPKVQTGPFVFSSPHSGRDYDGTFGGQSRLDALTLRSSEDAFVDQLFATAPDHGAPLLAARAPRAFVDLNRAADELDPAVIEDAPRMAHNPRIASGLGVVPRVVSAGRHIYADRMSRAAAEARLTQYWRPYHLQLRHLMFDTLERFGRAVLIDCHSMPHEAITPHGRPSHPTPEIVLGDRFGTTASADVVAQIEEAFKSAGLRVARNAPFAGAYIAQTYGRPSHHQHVVQIEIDRALYLDEARVEPRPDFAAFQTLISGVIAQITASALDLPLAAE
ncbi:N-formylglutamate amidohydrolase [Pseudorhodobacter antarcticus]|jgi:N-formylglutamate amidohydrolase|uniref:N-formylglutamate amidohydrolase n=2 Tax=Pseudorhodobacter antarcticus TaxID=1077947 RepID=A0A1H8AMH1_9RHOB|nr:N-formylglutamate amidohydrolase [Pseudorhodobacter antarcticus]